jgi:hypothetical protein
MSPKEQVLQYIEQVLALNIVTKDDLLKLANSETATKTEQTKAGGAKKLNVIDILFYLAGLIFYIALMVTAFQSGTTTSGMRVLITLGPGLLIWVVVFILGRQSNQSDINKGLINSLMLAGCLLVASGGFIAASQIADSQSSTLAYAVSLTFFLLGIAHLLFDRFFRHIILITLGVLFMTATFPSLVFALLYNLTIPPDVWALVGIASGLLLAYAGHIAAGTAPERDYLRVTFESVGAFIVLSSIYGAAVSSSVAPFWEILMPLTIYLAFFISIKRHSKNFLVTGSLFLVIFLITVSFKYFSGLGAAFCLMLSAVSILATAFMAANINKRYLRTPESRP